MGGTKCSNPLESFACIMMSAETDILSSLLILDCVPCKVLEGNITISSSLASNNIEEVFDKSLLVIIFFLLIDLDVNKPDKNSLCLNSSKKLILRLFF